jgi:hypothetical protein
MSITTTTELDEILSRLIRDLSVISQEDLIISAQLLERAYVHVLVERGLRK